MRTAQMNSKNNMKSMKSKYNQKTFFITIIVLCVLLGAILLSIMSGSYFLSAERVIRTLMGNGTRAENMAVLQIRLPRIAIALLVGLALSTAGGVLQTVTKNPLSEPGMIGINAGAALTVVLFITGNTKNYYDSLSMNKVILMPLVAIIGGVAASILIYFLSYKKGITPVRLILIGIGVNAGLNAVISYKSLTSSKGDYAQVLTWINGSLWGSSWTYVKLVAPIILVLFLFIMYKCRSLDVMQLGDELATGLGVNVQKESVILFFTAAILAAVATSVAGNIAFLGLIGPQIAKRLVGVRHRLFLPIGAMIGSAILIFADTAARNLFTPIEIPVGIAVSVIGVPYFIYLMLREK